MATSRAARDAMSALKKNEQSLAELTTPHLIDWIELQIADGKMNPAEMKNQYYFVKVDNNDDVAVYESRPIIRWGTPVAVTQIRFPFAFMDDPEPFYREVDERKRAARDEGKRLAELRNRDYVKPTKEQVEAAAAEFAERQRLNGVIVYD